MSTDYEKPNLASLILADDKNSIVYRARFGKALGVTAAILLQQINYWWQKNNREPFYKFKEPCEHDIYNPGDSWCEELGFSRREFDTALGRIAVKISKQDWLQGDLPSESLCYYYIDANRVTHYILNEKAFEVFVSELYKKALSSVRKVTNAPVPVKSDSAVRYNKVTETNTETTTETNMFEDVKNTSSNDPVNKKSQTNFPEEIHYQLTAKAIEAIHKTHPHIGFTYNQKKQIALMFSQMMRIDKRSVEDIERVLDWIPRSPVSGSGFSWKNQFQSPLKLRKKDREGVQYFDKFVSAMNEKPGGSHASRIGTIEEHGYEDGLINL